MVEIQLILISDNKYRKRVQLMSCEVYLIDPRPSVMCYSAGTFIYCDDKCNLNACVDNRKERFGSKNNQVDSS